PLGRKLDIDLLTHLRSANDDRHHPTRGQVLHLDQLFAARSVGELTDAKHRRKAFFFTAFGGPWHTRREGDCGRLEGGVAAAERLGPKFPPDQRCEHAENCLQTTQIAPNWDFIAGAVKKALRKLDLERCC